jgi:hypothetical protein
LWRGTHRAGIASDQPAARHEQLIVDLLEKITLWDLRDRIGGERARNTSNNVKSLGSKAGS